MNELQIFSNEEFGSVRTVEINGKPYFSASDIASALGYSNPRDAISRHCRGVVKHDGVSKTVNQYGVETEQTSEMSFIPEGDIYRLIIRSKLPAAEKFESWIFDEVIPSIRKHGAYMTEKTIEKALTSPDFLIQLATKLKEEQEKNKALAADNKRMKPKEEYYDELVDRNLLTNFRDTAKEFGIKERDFIELLRAKGYIYRDNGYKIRPYAGRNNGYFKLKEYNAKNSDHIGIQTLITAKGREKFRILVKELKDEQDKEKA